MATPAAVLSIMVKAQGVQAASTQLSSLDRTARKAGTGIATVEGHAKRSSRTLGLLGSAAKGAGGVAGIAGLAVAGKRMSDEFREAQKTGAQTTAVLKSTHGAAKTTKKSIEDLSNAISKKSGIDDENIQQSANMLLTFTKLRNETGKGNKVFDQATQTVTDMSVALGQSGKSSAIQLGKALNDPVKGITALRRVGVSFDAQQKAQIGTMVKSGNVLGAQKVILKELNKEFGGSAAAQTTAGDKFRVSLGNLAEAAGGILMPQVDKVAGALTKFFTGMTEGTGAGGKFVEVLASLAAKAGELWTAIAPLRGAIAAIFNWLVDNPNIAGILAGIAAAMWLVNAAVAANPFVLAAIAIAALVVGVVAAYREFAAFRNVVDTVVNAVKSAIPTMVTIAKGAMAAFLTVFRAVWPIIRGYFQGGFTAIKAIITGAAQILSGAVMVIKGVLTGDFREIWEGIKQIFRGGFTVLKGIITGAAQSVGNAALIIGTAIVNGIGAGLSTLGHFLLDKFKAAIGFVISNVGDIAKGIGTAIKNGIGTLNPFGDGPGGGGGGGSPGIGVKPIAPLPGGVKGLMGANANMAPFAAVGASFGLHVSSGKRAAGGLTSSGGVSYHGSGQAIDLADGKGPDAAKMQAFNALRSKYGSRLAELIYTPAGGRQIKNGQNFRYTGSVAADHFDHVHVAFTGGGGGTALGQAGNRGDGLGRFVGDGLGNLNRTFPKHGSSNAAGHVQLPPDVVRQIAVGAGLPGPAFEQIAHGESTYFPGIVSNDGGWGLWQMTPRVWGAEAKARLGQLGGIGAMLNPLKNAVMAKWLYDRGGLSPWFGTKYLTPEARAAGGAMKGKKGPGFGALTGGGTADPSGGGGSNAASGAASAAAKVNPLDQSLATADLAIEQSKRGGTVKAPGIAGRKISSAMRQTSALMGKRAIIGKRIASIRKQLKKHNSPAKRLALTQELTQRLQEHSQLGTDIAALRNPASADTGGGGIGGDVGGGSGGGDDPNQPLIDAINAAAEQAAEDARIKAEADAAHTQALNELQAVVKTQNQFATDVRTVQMGQLAKGLADFISQQIGSNTASRAFTAGAGSVVRY